MVTRTNLRAIQRTCASCDYFAAGHSHSRDFGQCRRYAPTRHSGCSRDDGVFVETHRDDWCGEWVAGHFIAGGGR